MNLTKLKYFFNESSYNLPIVIRKCETINNPSKTAKSLIYLLEHREGNQGYDPYLKTLTEIYNELNKQL